MADHFPNMSLNVFGKQYPLQNKHLRDKIELSFLTYLDWSFLRSRAKKHHIWEVLDEDNLKSFFYLCISIPTTRYFTFTLTFTTLE